MRNEIRQISGALALLRTNGRPVLAFQLWFAAFYAVLFGPVLAWLLNRLVGASGSLAVSNYELTRFFLLIPGILLAVAFAALNLGLIFTV